MRAVIGRSLPRDRLVQVQDHAARRSSTRRVRPASMSFGSGRVADREQLLRVVGLRRRSPCGASPARSMQDLRLFGLRLAAGGALEGPRDAGRVVPLLRRARAARRRGPPPRTRGRSAARAPAAGCSTAAARRCIPRGSARRTRPSPGAGTSAASACTCRGGTPCRPRPSATRGPGSSAPPSSPRGWYGFTLGPPIVGFSSPLTASALSRTNSASSRYRDCRANSLFIGSRSRDRRRLDRRLPVRRATSPSAGPCACTSHFGLELRRQPVEQFRVRRQFALRAGLFERAGDAVAEEELPEAVHRRRGRSAGSPARRSTSRGRAACSAPSRRPSRQRRQEARRVRRHHRAGFVEPVAARQDADRPRRAARRHEHARKRVLEVVLRLRRGGERVAVRPSGPGHWPGRMSRVARGPRGVRSSGFLARIVFTSGGMTTAVGPFAGRRVRPLLDVREGVRIGREDLRRGFELRLRDGDVRAVPLQLASCSASSAPACPARGCRSTAPGCRRRTPPASRSRPACTGRTCGCGTRRT